MKKNILFLSILILLLVKCFSQSPNYLWAKQQTAGGTSLDASESVATDANGNVIVTGNFGSSTITFGTTTLTNAGSNSIDIFIVKYDPNGNVLWAKQQTAGGTAWDNSQSVATDADGNIIVTGYFGSSTITFGTTTLTNAGSNSLDIFIVKYDPNGNVLWAKQQNSGGTGDAIPMSVAADSDGNVIVTGAFESSTITFGTTTLTNAGSENFFDIFIVKYDPNGNVLWAKQQDSGGTSVDAANGVAADPNGNVIITGYFNSSTITFGTNTLVNAGSCDIFIVKYDPNGNVLWAKQQNSGGTGDAIPMSVAADSDGNVIVTGYFESSSITFGTTTLTNAGSSDIFIVKLGTTTGIENNTLNNEVSVYPNPTTGLLFLSSSYNVTLIDLTGKIITKEQNTNTIDISNNPTGMYILLLTNNKGQIVQRSKISKCKSF